MFLAGAWIKENGEQYITPFDEEQIDCAAYTLRVGAEAYISPENPYTLESPIKRLGAEEPFSIPPGQFAFLISEEFVRVPFDLLAFINIKNGLKVQGLVNVSGFHVDPGYAGHLIFAVFNAGPKTMLLRRGEDAFLIWYARLEQASEAYARTKDGYMDIRGPLAAALPAQGVSLNSLGARLDKAERKFRMLAWALSASVALIVGTGGTVIGGWLLGDGGLKDAQSVRSQRQSE